MSLRMSNRNRELKIQRNELCKIQTGENSLSSSEVMFASCVVCVYSIDKEE